MGGQKKPTLTKLKKMLQGKKGRSDKKDEKKRVEYTVITSSQVEDELIKFIMRQRYVTPYMVSRKGEIKISEAKRLLRKLAYNSKVELVTKNRELEVYRPVLS